MADEKNPEQFKQAMNKDMDNLALKMQLLNEDIGENENLNTVDSSQANSLDSIERRTFTERLASKFETAVKKLPNTFVSAVSGLPYETGVEADENLNEPPYEIGIEADENLNEVADRSISNSPLAKSQSANKNVNNLESDKFHNLNEFEARGISAADASSPRSSSNIFMGFGSSNNILWASRLCKTAPTSPSKPDITNSLSPSKRGRTEIAKSKTHSMVEAASSSTHGMAAAASSSTHGMAAASSSSTHGMATAASSSTHGMATVASSSTHRLFTAKSPVKFGKTVAGGTRGFGKPALSSPVKHERTSTDSCVGFSMAAAAATSSERGIVAYPKLSDIDLSRLSEEEFTAYENWIEKQRRYEIQDKYDLSEKPTPSNKLVYIKVNIKRLSYYSLKCKSSDKVKTVHEILAQMTKIPVNQQILYIGEECMDPDKCLSDYNIN